MEIVYVFGQMFCFQKEIKRVLRMKPNTNTLTISPDRENIYLSVNARLPPSSRCSTLESAEAVLKPYFNRLRRMGHEFPKTLIYMPVEWCAQFHVIATEKYGIPPEQIAIFTGPQSDSVIKNIQES